MKKLLYAIVAVCALLAVSSCNKKEEVDDSLDGTWDVYTPLHSECQSFTFVFNGNKVEAYIIFWGDCLKGTYTYNDNKLHFNFDIGDAWDARVDDNATEIDETSLTDIDPVTLKPIKGYTWQAMRLETFEDDVLFLQDWEFERQTNTTGIGRDCTFKKRN